MSVTHSEPGIRCRKENSRGTENRKLRKKIFCGGKNRQAYFFPMKMKMMDL